jgi:lipid II:glycine glycyltransferase (peptidoglycan interpeptide bridge formation enzyme)
MQQEAGRTLANPLWNLGFSDSSAATWMTRLAGLNESALWQKLEGRARTAARKATTAGVRVVEEIDQKSLETYIGLHQATAEREALTGMPTQFFNKIWNGLLAHGLAKAYFAMLGDEAVAAVIIFVWKGGASYNSGAMNLKGRKVEANSLLLWHATKATAAAGYRYFDYGEAAPPNAVGKARNLSDFKRSFGGELYPLWRGRRAGPGRWLPKLAAIRSALAVHPTN